MKNFIFIATIIFIIGILMGLYLNISIVFLLCLILCVLVIFFYDKCKRLNRVNINVIFILIFVLLFSALYSNYKIKLFNEKYKDLNTVRVVAKVINIESENDYNITYIVKVKSLNNLTKYSGTNILLKVKKTNTTNINLGDIIYFEGDVKEPDARRNFNGFDYKRYLNSKNIYTVINSNIIKIIKENKGVNIYCIKQYIIDRVEKVTNNNNSGICLALILGYKVNIPDEINEDFKNSNLLHILAISGMHVSYITLILNFIFKSFSKKSNKILIIIFLIFYIILTGSNPSVTRACIMQILSMLSRLVYRKSNIKINMSISALILLIINPIIIYNIGFLFSYIGTISIVIFNKYIQKAFDFLEIKFTSVLKIKLPNQKNVISRMLEKIYTGGRNILIVTISANVFLLPLSMYYFKSFSCTFIISNLIVQPILPVVMTISCIQIVISCISINLGYFVSFFSNFFISLFLKITHVCAKIPFSKIITISPSKIFLVIFYFSILTIFFLNEKGKLNKNNFSKLFNKIKNILKKPIVLLIIFILIINLVYFKSLPNDLKIFFIDVGQGDSTLIITPNNKKILIDGGGSELGKFDVGESTLLPYLLSRKIKTLDYIIISHFDSDHVGGILYILKELKVKNVIIGKQYEETENLRNFLQIVKENKIKVFVVEEGSKINIEENLYFNILWPDSKNIILENSINNNAIVCNLFYRNFRMLFTGDIEEETEKILVSKYSGTNILKCNVLKVAHHGSKSSSTREFLELVKPEVALIGVGKNNLYGHPSKSVITRLEDFRHMYL